MKKSRLVSFLAAVLSIACAAPPTDLSDAAASTDAASELVDAGTTLDAAVLDAAAIDAAAIDAAAIDAAAIDAAAIDAAAIDAAAIDAAAIDAAAIDAAAAVDAASFDGAIAHPPLLLALTLHLENRAPYDDAYFDSLEALASTFETHGARLTLEPRMDVVTAGGARFTALEARGHAVGSHAAIGGTDPITLAAFTTQARARRTQLLPLVDRIDHISGNCALIDWVDGISTAGFSFTTAATALCILAMAEEDRPPEHRALVCTGSADPACHTSYPSAIAERIHPWRTAEAAHWLTDDPAGAIVVLPGSGTLPCLEEESTWTGPGLPSCTFTDADITLALADLDAGIALVDADRANSFYWIWGSWDLAPSEQPVLERFLDAIDERAARGEVRWSTAVEQYDAFVAWESTHR